MTDQSGYASFSYQGTAAGVTDTMRVYAQYGSDKLASNTTTTTVNWAALPNYAPVVSAGEDQTITWPNTAQLTGTVTDDGLPASSTLTIAWSKVAGPGTVTFATPNRAASIVSAT